MPIKDSDVPLETLKKMERTHVCQCGGALVVAWGGAYGHNGYVLRCGKNPEHSDFIRPKTFGMTDNPDVPGWRMSRNRRVNMEQELGPERTRAVMKYQGVAKLSKDAVREIVVTIWPDAPDVERKKAILLCTQYNLNPLMKHIYILGPFTDKKTGEVSWSLALSVQTNRLMASRQGRFSYVDNTPRIMTDDEQKTIFGEVDHTKLWAITKIRDNQGNEAQGYGNWPRDRIAYGEDKGNTKANMAFVRSERQALARLRPDALPENVEVVDEKYVPASGQIIDASTGEIVTSEAKQVIKSEATVRSPDGIDETGEHFAEPPKGETSDLKSLTFANQGEFYAACLKHFNVNKTQVDKEVPEYNLADKGQRQKAWLQIVAVYGSKE